MGSKVEREVFLGAMLCQQKKEAKIPMNAQIRENRNLPNNPPEAREIPKRSNRIHM